MRIGPVPTALAASAYLSIKLHQRCRVMHDRGLWVHEFRDGVIVKTMIGGSSVRTLDRDTRHESLFQYVPKLGDTIVDVGAGIGEGVLTFSRLVGNTGRVISIEAHPTTFACLSEVVRRNDLTNVVTLQAAVSGTDGSLDISDMGGTSLSNTVMAGERGIKVRAITLDTLAAEYKITHVDFLKSNIEGAERLMIEGMTSLVSRVRNVSISCHDFIADRTADDSFRTKELVRTFLVNHGFEVTEREDKLPELSDTLYARRVAS